MRNELLLFSLVLGACEEGTAPSHTSSAERLFCHDVVITSDADVAAFADCNQMHSLTIDHTALTSVSFPVLDTVVDRVKITQNPDLASIDLPALTSAWRVLVRYDDSLTTLTLPALQDAGVLRVAHNAQLASVSAPLWTGEGGLLWLRFNPVLTTVDVPLADEIDVRIDHNALSSFALPGAATLGRVWVTSEPDLQTLDLSGAQDIWFLNLDDLPVLTDLDLSQLVVASSWITDAPALQGLDLPAATDFFGLLIAHLDTCVSITAPNLVSTGDYLWVTDSALLTTVDMPLATGLGDLTLLNDPALTTVTFGPVTTLNSLAADMEPASTLSLADVTTITFDLSPPRKGTLSVPQLNDVGGSVLLNYGEGTTLDLPALAHVGGDVLVDDNPFLATLTNPALTTVDGDLKVRRNGALCFDSSRWTAAGETRINGNLCD